MSGDASAQPAPTLHLEHRPAPPWISAAAPVFRSAVECTGLLIAVPCYGGMLTAATARSLLDTQRAALTLGLPFAVATTTNESLVPRARNALAARFLASSASHLLFADSDIGFGADAVLRLLGHGRPLIGGLYRAKATDRQEWVVQFPAGPRRPPAPRPPRPPHRRRRGRRSRHRLPPPPPRRPRTPRRGAPRDPASHGGRPRPRLLRIGHRTQRRPGGGPLSQRGLPFLCPLARARRRGVVRPRHHPRTPRPDAPLRRSDDPLRCGMMAAS